MGAEAGDSMNRRDFFKTASAPVAISLAGANSIKCAAPKGRAAAMDRILSGEAKEFTGEASLIFGVQVLTQKFRLAHVGGGTFFPETPVIFRSISETFGRLDEVAWTAYVDGLEFAACRFSYDLTPNGGDICLRDLGLQL